MTSPEAPSTVSQSPRRTVRVARPHLARRLVDLEFLRAHHAALAHPARHHGGVTGLATPAGHDRHRGHHPLEVVRGGLRTDQDHRVALAGFLDRFLGGENDAAADRAGRGRIADGERSELGRRIDHRMKHLLQAVGLDPQHGLFARDEAFVGHVHRDPDGRARRALAGTGLQQVQGAVLDRELQVLHLVVVRLQLASRVFQLLERLRHVIAQPVDREGVANPGHDVFALGIDQELPEQLRLTRRGVAREGDAGAAIASAVAVDHGLDVHGGPEVVWDPVGLPVGLGPWVPPAAEHGFDRSPQLVLRILRERGLRLRLDQPLVAAHDVPQGFGIQFVVRLHARLRLGVRQDGLERIVPDLEHHVRVHLQEAPVAVVREALVAGYPGQRLHGPVVEPQVQDRVHHPRHRDGPA